MGHPVDPPAYSVNDCPCYPIGLSPQTVVLFISGVDACPGLPVTGKLNGAFLCTSGLLCIWHWTDGTTSADIHKQLFGALTQIVLAAGGVNNFITVAGIPCANGGPNQNACLLFVGHGVNGNAFVDPDPWPSVPLKLTDEFNLLPSEETFTDPYIIQDEPPTTVVYTLANIQYSTKLRIKFDYTI